MPWPITFIPRGKGTQVRYARDEARETIAGYAFGTTGLGWKAPGLSRDSHLSLPPSVSERQAWAYRIFDCVQTNPERIEVADVAITAALDSQVGSTAILGVTAIKDDLNAVLAQIPIQTKFWELPVMELGTETPPHDQTSWWMWRAWTLLMGLPQVERAVTHKLLHRKRPQLFPMLDSLTSPHLGGEHAWTTIYHDLTRHSGEFTDLENWFGALASACDGVPLPPPLR